MKSHIDAGRRGFLKGLAGGAGVSLLGRNALKGEDRSMPAIKAIAFDAFPIFDPRPVFQLADVLYPGKGQELSNEWRTRQFEYTWLRTISGRYADFERVTEDALVYTAKKLKLDLTDDRRTRLVKAYRGLTPWPDVRPALETLKQMGVRLGFLSNFTPAMLESCIKTSKLEGMFERALSTDQVKTFKPDPRAYQLGVDGFGLKREEILFVAFAGWDAAGAKTFGYPTYWVNRLRLPAEELDVMPDATGQSLESLIPYVKS